MQRNGWVDLGNVQGFVECFCASNDGTQFYGPAGLVFDPIAMEDTDVIVQYETAGDDMEVTAWFVGEEKPTRPQFRMEKGGLERASFVGVSYDLHDGNGTIGPAAIRFVALLPKVAGDFSASNSLDVEDIDLIDRELRGQAKNRVFDLNEDARVTSEDRRVLIKDLLATWYGDSNLDGEFDSTDLVSVFQTGEYEDAIEGNSTWATGDWDGSGDVDSADLVIAFQEGGYEQGPQAAVNSVPEPSAAMLLALGLTSLALNAQRRRTTTVFN